MNINDKKVQRVIMGAVTGCALVFLVVQFVILPAVTSWKEDSAKARKVQATVSEMRALVQLRPSIQGQIDTARAAIKKMGGNIPLPVLGNYLLDMEEYIRGCATGLGVTLASIADNDIIEISPGNSAFKVYRVRVQAKAGYDDCIRLVMKIHSGNPICSISGLNIVPRDGSPEAHEISFAVAWLIWSDPASRPALLIEGKK